MPVSSVLKLCQIVSENGVISMRFSFHLLFLAIACLAGYAQCYQPAKTSFIKMGLFDFFGPKKTASASHILMKGNAGLEQLVSIKNKLATSKKLKEDFAEAAAKFSACPSSARGGALGTFKQGQMVPAFDKVVFSEEIGVVHGPVKTPFGAHLILIDSRSE